MIEKIINSIDKVIDNVAEFHIEQAKSMLLNRVFEENTNANGVSFGKYTSKSYMAYRKKLGRQINKVDLQLKENLIKSIVVGKTDDGYALFYNNDEQKKIGGYQDIRYGKTFAISDAEHKELLQKSLQYLYELNNSVFT